MGARRPQPSCLGAAAPLLLLLAMFFSVHAAAEAGGALGLGAGMTELQKHAAFFDRDHDGIVTIVETYKGLRAIGLGADQAKSTAAFINGALGPRTGPDNATSSSTDIYIKNIQKGKHQSDTGAYNAQGRFVPAKLDEMFAKHGRTVPNSLTKAEVDEMLNSNRESNDSQGWIASKLEWETLYMLGKDRYELLHKGTARAIYDGTLFYQLAQCKKG